MNRIRVKDHFDSIAKYRPKRNKDLSKIPHLYQIRLMRTFELLGTINGLKLLDIGCGTGLTVESVLENGGRYVGIDLSKEMLKEFSRASGEDASIPLAAALMENLPFPEASFDRVLCLGVLEYVEDLDSAFAELARILRDNGFVIISMQNSYGLYRLWERHIYSGFLFNTLRKLRGRPIAGEMLEKSKTLKELLSFD